MKELERASISTLEVAQSIGKVVIVTNAKMEWVRFSMVTFLHGLYEFVVEEKIPILSAQDVFGSDCSNPVLWKISTFRHLLLSCEDLPRNLISVGDGMHERIAYNAACNEFGVPGIHIRFKANPTLQELTLQLNCLRTTLENIPDMSITTKCFMRMVSSCDETAFEEHHAGEEEALGWVESAASDTDMVVA